MEYIIDNLFGILVATGIIASFLMHPRVITAIQAFITVLTGHERDIPPKLTEYLGTTFADELPFELLMGDYLLTKDGALMRGYAYAGRDVDSITSPERDAMQAKINNALSRLGSGWSLHVESVNEYANEYPTSERYQSPLAQYIDKRRKAAYDKEGNRYVSHKFFFLRFQLEETVNEKMGDWLDDEVSRTDRSNGLSRQIERYNKTCDYIVDQLNDIFSIYPLGVQELVNHDGETELYSDLLEILEYLISGKQHPISVSEEASHCDLLIGNHELHNTGDGLMLDDNYVGVLGIGGYPSHSAANMLRHMDSLAFRYRWSTRFIFLDEQEALGEIKKEQRYWASKKRPFIDQMFNKGSGRINTDAVDMDDDAQEAKTEVEKGIVKYGMYTSTFIMLDKNKESLAEKMRQAKNAFDTNGFRSIIETINRIDGYLGSIPGNTIRNVRKPMIHTLNLANLLPTSSIWMGEKYCSCRYYPRQSPPLIMCKTRGNKPYGLSLHQYDNGHTVIAGPAGNGKSTLLATMVLQHMKYPQAQAFMMDVGRSLYPVTLGLNGRYYDLDPEKSPFRLAPLSRIGESTLEKEWAQDWIERLCAYATKGTMRFTPDKRKRLRETLNLFVDENDKTITKFAQQVQDEDIKEVLEEYTEAGKGYGAILDGEKDDITIGGVTCIEMSELMKLDDRYLYPIVEYFWHIQEKTLDQKKPTIHIFDEAATYFRNDIFRNQIEELIEKRRKMNEAIIIAIQSVVQMQTQDHKTFSIIQDNCASKIFLANDGALTEKASEQYELLGLNEKQIANIAGMKIQREYMIVKGSGTRIFDLDLDDETLAFVGANIPEFKQMAELHTADPENFWINWLKAKGLEAPQNTQAKAA